MTLTGSKPIVLQDTLKVEAGATLTIPAGTTLYFSQKASLEVYGSLRCEGTADHPVVLRGDRLDRLFPYLPYDHVSGQWQGIHFHTDSYDNVISHTDLHSAYNGIVCDAANISQNKLTLANSTMHNCQGYGLKAVNCKVEAYNTQFSNTLMDCASFLGGHITLTHCTFAQFYPFDSNRGAALSLGNHEGDKDYPLQAFNCYARQSQRIQPCSHVLWTLFGRTQRTIRVVEISNLSRSMPISKTMTCTLKSQRIMFSHLLLMQGEY